MVLEIIPKRFFECFNDIIDFACRSRGGKVPAVK